MQLHLIRYEAREDVGSVHKMKHSFHFDKLFFHFVRFSKYGIGLTVFMFLVLNF